jgi:hypothetical protein
MAGERRKAGGQGGKKKGGDVPASSSPPVSVTAASLRVDGLKTRIASLRARDTAFTEQIERDQRELTEQIERDHREQAEVRGALAAAEAELEVEVHAPVANGVDPTAWLPDELLMAILIHVAAGGACRLACRRWHAACHDRSVKRRAWEGRWEGYSAGWRVPQKLIGDRLGPYSDPSEEVCALAVGPEGTVYSATTYNGTYAWSGTGRSYLRALDDTNLVGFGSSVLAVGGPDSTVYAPCPSGSGSICVWSGTDGRCLDAIHTPSKVLALAVAVDGTLFVSSHTVIRAWSKGEHVRTILGHSDTVVALAIGTQGRLYSGSDDTTIRVWSIADGTHLATLAGHTLPVRALAVGADGTLHSGSADATVRVWSGDDGRLLLTLRGHAKPVASVAVDSRGTIFSASADATIRVWCSGARTVTTSYILYWVGFNQVVYPPLLVVGRDDKLFATRPADGALMVW